MEGGVQLQLGEGRNEGWEVGALLGAICRSMGINRDDVGNIRLRENSASVELSAKAAELLESRKSRMTKEGLKCSSIRMLTKTSQDGRQFGRSARYDRPDLADRPNRPSRGSRKGESDRPRSRKYSC